jgi:hypothetical protein
MSLFLIATIILIEMQIIETNIEDTRYFINLIELDLSENEILLEDLIYF